jgi:hypothetical protein
MRVDVNVYDPSAAKPARLTLPGKATFVLAGVVVIIIFLMAIAVVLSPVWKQYQKRQQKRTTSLEHYLAKRPQTFQDPLAAQSNYDQSFKSASFQIKGDRKGLFKNQVLLALQMIWENDRPMFNEIKRYVYVIRLGDKTSFEVEEGVPTIVITNKTAFRSVTWCAGAIAHQLFLARNYFALKQRDLAAGKAAILGRAQLPEQEIIPIEVNYSDMKSYENFEKQADAYHILILRRLKAPANEISAIINRPPYDYSYTHDGVFQPGT